MTTDSMSPDSMPTVIAEQGELVDQIALRCYGTTAMAGDILEANPGLAALGAALPHGTKVRLPPARAQTTRPISLWD